MLAWFKKKLNKKEEQSAAPAEPHAEVLEEAVEKAVEIAEVSVNESAAAQDQNTTEPEETAGEKEVVQQAGLFKRLAERLAKTRSSFVNRLDALFLGRKKIDAALYEELEELLITADLGVRTTHELLEKTRLTVERNKLDDPAGLKRILKDHLLEYLVRSERSGEMVMPEVGPFVIMVLGVNGVGKTTTIGKMAYKFVKSGRKVLLVAADTFRAAAVDQLKIWGERIGVEVVAQQQGADPSSVIYDALDYAGPRNFDVMIVDTAGRLHTKVNLMEELKKIKRVIGKKLPGAPHEIMLVIDATTGQNGISQARLFNEAVDLTGLTLTKLDGTAKGGIVVNICNEFEIPIRFIGIGEKMEDLRDFEPREFIDALFAERGNGERG